MTFPRVSASNLEGRKFNLPHDFAGDYHLVVLGFEMWHQPMVDSWMPFMREITASHANVDFYNLPVILEVEWLHQKMLDMSMRKNIADLKIREATIPLYLDVQDFCTALKLPNTHQIYTLLLDHDGTVLWREAGEYRAEAGDAFLKMLCEPQMV